MKFKNFIYFLFFACGTLFSNEYYNTINEVQDYYKKQYSVGSIAYNAALDDIQKIVSSGMTQEEKCKKLKQLLPSKHNFFVKNDFSWTLKNISIAYRVGAEWTECFSYTQDASISMSKSNIGKIASAKTDIKKKNSSSSTSSSSGVNENKSKSFSIGGSLQMQGIFPRISANIGGSYTYGNNSVQSNSNSETHSSSNDFSTTDIESIEISAVQKARLDNLAQKVSSNSVKLSDIFLQLDVEFYNGTDIDLEIPQRIGLEFGSGFMFLDRQSGIWLPKGRSTLVIYKTPLSDTAKLGIVNFIRNDGKPYLDMEKSGIILRNQYNEDLICKYADAKINSINVSFSSNGELSKFSINSNYHENDKVSLGDIVENLNKIVYGSEILAVKDDCLIINGVSSKPEENSEWIVSILLNDKTIPNTKVSKNIELKKGDSLIISVDKFEYCFENEILPSREVIEQYVQQNNFLSQLLFLEKYDNRNGINDKEIFKLYKKAAEQGYFFAQKGLVGLYLVGKGVERNNGEAFKWCKKAAEQGDKDAQNWLGVMYYKGRGVAQNYEEAFKWCKKAAEQGNKYAQNWLGIMYYEGKGVSQNYEEAFKWHKKSAEQGYRDAQFCLGSMYYNGKGVAKNYEEAFKWYKKSAEQGDEYSQYRLGSMYYNGDGVVQNYKEAFNWCKKAAEQGHKVAQYWLGDMYYDGKGVSQNYEEAFKWYKKSAEQGYKYSQYWLGHMYYNGEGIEKNNREAFKWYKKAADQGHEIAQKSVNNLKFFYEK